MEAIQPSQSTQLRPVVRSTASILAFVVTPLGYGDDP